jgi:hypothetical protein
MITGSDITDRNGVTIRQITPAIYFHVYFICADAGDGQAATIESKKSK